MEFKINFAYFVSLFLLVIFSVNLADEIVKAIRNKSKKKVDKLVFDNLSDSVAWLQGQFLIKEHGFTDEQLDGLSVKDLCNECSYRYKCASGSYPKCLIADEELLEKIHRSKI